MPRILDSFRLVAILALAFLSVRVAAAQQTSPATVPPAPIPAQILMAKKVFISNPGGEEPDPRTYFFTPTSASRPYDQFYAAIKSGGRFEPVLIPADADLILEIRFTYSLIALETHLVDTIDPQLRLEILDPKTHALLWAFKERVETPSGPHAKEKRENKFNQAMAALVNDLSKLAAQPSTPANANAKD